MRIRPLQTVVAWCRLAIVYSFAATLLGCYSWHTERLAPVLAWGTSSQVRITRIDGSRVILEAPRLRSDTLRGIERRGMFSRNEGEIGVPLSAIKEIATPRFSSARTAGLVIGILASPVVFFELACLISRCAILN